MSDKNEDIFEPKAVELEETDCVEASPAPEGGTRAWATLCGSFLIQFCGFGYGNSFGVYQDFYVRRYLTEFSPSAISWIGSINTFLIIAGGLVVGRLYDKGLFLLLLYGGSLLLVFSLFMLSLAHENQYYQIFLSQGIGVGLGSGMLYVPSIAILSQYFQKRRALAMGIAASGASIGSIVHPIMLNNLFVSSLGFGNTVRASASLVSVCLICACFLMKPRLPPSKPPNLRNCVRKLVKDKAFIFATFGLLCATLGLYFVFFYLQLDAVQHGLDENFAFYTLVILNGAGFFGRVMPGILSQKLGILNMVLFANIGAAIVILCMIRLADVASVVLIALFYGFFSGSIVSLMPPLVAVLTDDPAELGARMGICFSITGLGGLVGSPISGAILTSHYHWTRADLFAGLIALSGAGLMVIMRIITYRHHRDVGEGHRAALKH